jgi:cytochrome oxidase assembly protein ShyY1
VWSLLQTRRWLAFTLLVVVAITGFGLLSRWQWERAEEERLKRVAWAAQASAPAVSITDAIADTVEWTPVRVSGTYDPASTVLVRQRPLDGRNGFWVTTALDTDQGRLWVNRGWIPVSGAATGVVAAPESPTGPVVVEGRLRWAERTAQPAPRDLPAGQVAALDPTALDADITSFYLEATASEPRDPMVMRMPAPAPDETQNISYALQWMVFAVIALTGWWYFLRREAREDATLADDTTSGAS